MTNKICDGCETVAHCLKNGCVPKLDTIAMAREASGPQSHDWWHNDTDLERFAAFVAAAEREACAKVCDGLAELKRTSPTDSMWEQEECAAAIRARGVASIRGETK